MRKRLRKKMWKLGRLEYGELFMEMKNDIDNIETVYLPENKYYLNSNKIYKFKI